jgi:hypothetical protein
MHVLSLIIAIFTFDDILRCDAALTQVDISLVTVDAQHEDDLLTVDADQLVDGTDATA